MSKTTRKTYPPKFKMAAAVDVVTGEKTLSQVAAEHGAGPSLAAEWRDELLDGVDDVFGRTQQERERKRSEEAARKKYDEALRKIGQLAVEPRATRWRVTRLMGLMGIRPCCPLPSLSAPSKASRRFPYLLRGKVVRSPRQVWPTDIACVQIGGTPHVPDGGDRLVQPLHRVVAAVGHHARPRGCRLCGDAFASHGAPGVMNSDQGSVFGSEEYVSLLASEHVAQSMDGRARWADNVLMEGLCAQAHNPSNALDAIMCRVGAGRQAEGPGHPAPST